MGVESANYQIRYSDDPGEGFTRAMLVLGAEVVDDGSSVRSVVRSDDRYWLDLQAWPERSLVSVRVALCNPPEVLPMLRTVLSVLAAAAPGVVVDVDGDAHYVDLADRSWSAVAESFERRRAEFRQYFGDYTAAISGGEVFARLRDRKASD